MVGLSNGIKIVRICLAVSREYRRGMDGHKICDGIVHAMHTLTTVSLVTLYYKLLNRIRRMHRLKLFHHSNKDKFKILSARESRLSLDSLIANIQQNCVN